MFCSHDPVPDSWYVNENGKVIKVRLLLYQGGRLAKVLTEDIDGVSGIINYYQWYELNLSRYCYAPRSFGQY